jgi:hypothetical protein
MKIKSFILAALAASTVLVGSAWAANVNVPRTISANTTWTKDNVYFLEGYTFVINDATLTIEPGTVIKGRQSTGSNAASLIITRGAKIMAEGTREQPIVFTSELDNLNGNLSHTDTGLWGGVIVLGKARINSRANNQPAGNPAQDQIEGVSVTGDEIDWATFGGTDDDDNSGVIRYVSIRHGGAVIGGDNEINGLTMGGVGRGTTVEYVEVFANKDDSFEWFGGTVNARYLVSSFGNDDGLDFDQGYRGQVQFVFSIKTDIGADRGDKSIEWDGATAPLDATPKGVVTVANMTAIGVGPSGGNNTAVNIRDNVEARLFNSIFVNHAKGLDIEDDVGTPIPAICHNLWWSHIEANNTAAGQNARPAGAVNANNYWTDTSLGNVIANPQLRGISYTKNMGLDPRPAAGSPALSGTTEALTGNFLTPVGYKGAFNTNLWISGWTALDQLGYLVDAGNNGGGGNEIPDITTGSTSKPINVSTRGQVGTDANIMIVGFVIAGNQQQTVLIRAVGPTLGQAPFNVPGVLADPTIELYNAAGTKIAENNNWGGSSAMADIFSRAGAFALPADSLDCALVVNVAPGAYTVQVRGANGGTGVAIVEVYEID